MSWFLPSAGVFSGLSVPEELEGGVASDLELLGQGSLLGGVNLAQLDVGLLLAQDAGGLGVLGSQSLKKQEINLKSCSQSKNSKMYPHLAMSAPGGVELNQDEFVLGDDAVEVLLGQDKNSLLLGHLLGVDGHGHQKAQAQRKYFHLDLKKKEIR